MPLRNSEILLLVVAMSMIASRSSAIGLTQTSSVYGTYQYCPFHCNTIRINPDHTFDYKLDGDLYNNLKVRGTWKFIDRNRLQAVSPEDRTAPNVEEKVSTRNEGFLVTVKFFWGGYAEGVKISGTANGSTFSAKANNYGEAVIPKTQQFEVVYEDLYRGLHVVRNSEANNFNVTLTVEQVTGITVNEEWLIEGNKLFLVQPDGSVHRDIHHVKLNRKAERRISW